MAFSAGAVDIDSTRYVDIGLRTGGIMRIRNVGQHTAYIMRAQRREDGWIEPPSAQLAQYGYPVHPGESLDLPDPAEWSGVMVPIAATATGDVRLHRIGGL